MMVRESVVVGGRTLSIETGRIAKQASGAALVQYGKTVVLVTATADRNARPGSEDFLPLTVDYREKTYSAGKIPGGYFKREGRPSTLETLVDRLIDRPIRPLFAAGWRYETQVIALVLSMDQENDPSLCGMIGASAALMLSDIPWQGPLAAVRVGRINGQFVINPTYPQQDESDLDLVMSVGKSGIVMVEAGAKTVPEDVLVDGLMFGQTEAQAILELQERVAAAAGKTKRVHKAPETDAKFADHVADLARAPLTEALNTKAKLDRYAAVDEVRQRVLDELGEGYADRTGEAKAAFEELKKEIIRSQILDKTKRLDGRGLKDIRPITCEVGVLPTTHGSALFTRGETQVLVTLTLGTSQDVQHLEQLTGDVTKRFLLHYNFPPFCVGEVRRMSGPSRRDIGHGALAERGVKEVLPNLEAFPYTLRLVSEVMESNGSSSMATVCGSSLALMDGGVPIRSAVAGIAMGLVKKGRKVRILSDIMGDEDHYGDMDFKVVGNRDGITALQMDIKCDGLSRDILMKALEQAREARFHVLDQMALAIDAPRPELSPYSPRIETLRINPDRIRDLIGPGGKNIRSIIEQTNVTIDVMDEGLVTVAAVDEQAMRDAIALVRRCTEEAEVGRVYLGRVVKVTDFGAFVQILPGTEGLCHISELADRRVNRVEDVVRENDEVLVKVIGIDRQGKIKLSRREALGHQSNTPSGDASPSA